jgi:hypothetical protein
MKVAVRTILRYDIAGALLAAVVIGYQLIERRAKAETVKPVQ